MPQQPMSAFSGRDWPAFLRACLKRLTSCQAPDHQASHGEVDQGFATLRQRFIIFAQTPKLSNPGKSTLDDPASGQDYKTFLVIAAQDWP